MQMTFLFNQGTLMKNKYITPEQFYELYPNKKKGKKAKARFARLSKKEKLLAWQALPNHIKYWEHKRKSDELNGNKWETKTKYIPHPLTWINGASWEDEIELPKTKKQKTQNVNLEVMQFRKKQEKLLEDAAEDYEKKDALSGFLGRKKWKKIK
jgi:hypothetical protein